VKRLQRKGLLRRRRSNEDARVWAVTITEQGRQVLRTAEPLAKRVDERILAALPAQRRGDFIDRLRSIVDSLQA
jgi:DNA-binding MarR family transcriptional regulator